MRLLPDSELPARFEVEVEKIYKLVATNAQEERITLTIRGKNQSVSFDMKLSKSISAISAVTMRIVRAIMSRLL